jgi:hypothetical protein
MLGKVNRNLGCGSSSFFSAIFTLSFVLSISTDCLGLAYNKSAYIYYRRRKKSFIKRGT